MAVSYVHVMVAAILAGLAVAIFVSKPLLVVAGIGAAMLYMFYRRQVASEEEMSPNDPDPGQARMHEEPVRVDPRLFPIPFRTQERRFAEDPMDDRIRWPTTGPLGPYTAWRRGFF